jgi:hypothetical protein
VPRPRLLSLSKVFGQRVFRPVDGPQVLCLTKMPSGQDEAFFRQTCVRGFRHLLPPSGEQVGVYARERTSGPDLIEYLGLLER